MKKINLKQFDRIEITWLDSVHDFGWERSDLTKNWGELDQLTHHTIGYLLNYNKSSTVIVQSFQEKIIDNTRTTDARMEIPNCSIIKIKKLI